MLLTRSTRFARTRPTIAFPSFCSQTRNIRDEIEKQIQDDACVVYMKGTPTQPQCGFSKTVVDILNLLGARYTAHDVLQDPLLRESIKQFSCVNFCPTFSFYNSDWPTIPQIYLNGTFIGGCDILLSHYRAGELKKMLEEANAIAKE
eukprot:TRINITY_DN250_c0_g2_i21.p1 TRINITY_DN250_c0_g2~~TRINITY_DN250_c0_g2_i21.p1  ORF type:complete len:147 (+),score=20.30 TRINITY_DN250_c0_g2_i21:74-514(+)